MRKRKNAIWWIILVIGLLAVNFIASKLHSRFDLTEEKRYSLSQPVKSLFGGLNETVTIDVLVEANDMPAYVKKFQNSIEEFLSEAREYGNNKIQYRFINPYSNLSDTASERVLEDSLEMYYGLRAFLIDAPSKVGDKMEITKLIHGAIVRYQDRSVGIDFLSGIDQFGTTEEDRKKLYNEVESKLEYKFASTIQKITATTRPVVRYALGHGETWGYNINDVFITLRNEYDCDTINLIKEAFIPTDVNALVILKPTIAFTDADKLKLDQYIMNGGKVFMMLDNMYTELDSLRKTGGFIAFDRGLNLEDLLFNYGVRLNSSLLQDMQCDFLEQQSSDGTQRRKVDWPFFPILNGTEHPVSKNLAGVRLMFPSTMDTVEAEGIRKTFLLQSTQNARILTAPARIDFSFFEIAPDEKLFIQKNIPAAVLLEGKFRSLFTGRVGKATSDSMAANKMRFKNSSSADNKIIVVSDGDLAMNQFSPNYGPLPMGINYFYPDIVYSNKDFFLNAMEYLVNPTNFLQTRAKEFSLRLLDEKKVADEKTKWQLITIAVPILLVIILGFIYQQIRRQKFVKG